MFDFSPYIKKEAKKIPINDGDLMNKA